MQKSVTLNDLERPKRISPVKSFAVRNVQLISVLKTYLFYVYFSQNQATKEKAVDTTGNKMKQKTLKC